MKMFRCSPEWPICLYDFTFKNKNPSYLCFKVADPLNYYVFDEYFFSEFDHMSLETSDYTPYNYNNIESRDDLVIERTNHVCNRSDFPFFVSNFKTRYQANDLTLFKNENLKLFIEDDGKIPQILELFV